jgi:hypothetical protein
LLLVLRAASAPKGRSPSDTGFDRKVSGESKYSIAVEIEKVGADAALVFVRILMSSGQISRTMKRFVITVLLATMIHAIGCILAPPFEFGHNRPECFVYAFISGIISFPILFAVLLLPLRAGLRRFMPLSTQYTHAIVAGVVLYALRASIILARQLSGVPSLPFQHGYLAQWLFWSFFVIAITISFFWPFGPPANSYNQAA